MTGTRNSTGPASWRRWAGAIVAGLAGALLWGTPASAHGNVTMTVHSDGRGSVWMTAAWSDNHPISDPIGAILTGTSSTGAQVGPVPLRQTGDALTYTGELAPGDWTLTAEMGTPAIGRCAATVHIVAASDPAPSPAAITCATSPAPGPTAAAAPATSSAWPGLAAIGGAGAFLAAGVALWIRARPMWTAARRVRPVPAAARQDLPAAGRRRP